MDKIGDWCGKVAIFVESCSFPLISALLSRGLEPDTGVNGSDMDGFGCGFGSFDWPVGGFVVDP